MQIVCDASLNPGTSSNAFGVGRIAGIFIAKLTCSFKGLGRALVLTGSEAEPLSGDTFVEGQHSDSLCKPTDFSPYKPKFDFLVTGTAYSPSRKPQAYWDVRCSIGAWSKSLRVFGPRRWIPERLGYRISQPAPIKQLTLDYRNAFGGPESKYNPAGSGQGAKAETLPAIEFPDRLVRRPDDDLPPAGFGPLSATWLPRTKCLGTYNNLWQQTRWPWFPADFDYAFFNAAPPDQQFDLPLVGNEVLEFENLHPERRVLRTQLPGLRVRCFVSRFPAKVLMPAEQFTEVPMVFDTLQVDLDRELATLLWRGNTPVESIKMPDIKTLFMMVESVEVPPQSHASCIDHYRRLRLEQMGLQDTPLDQLTEEPDARRTFAQQMTSADAESKMHLQEAEAMVAQAKEQAIVAGAESALFETQPASTSPGKALTEAIGQLQNMINQLRQEDPESAEKLSEQLASLEEAQALLPRELSREQVEPMIAARESFAKCSLVEMDLQGLDFSGLDCSQADFSHAKLQNARFVGANLAQAKLEAADLTAANFRNANLNAADFTRSTLQDGCFAQAAIGRAIFAEQTITRVDFGQAHGHAPDFSQTKLADCDFHSVCLPAANFTSAEMVNCNFEEAELRAAQWEGVKAPRIRMRGANLVGIHASDGADFTEGLFQQIRAEGSIWQGSTLDRADFTESRLTQALFTEASLRQTRFDRSDLTRASLDDCQLQHASLDQCNLLYASLERANLTEASMRQANIYQAGFWDAQFEKLDLR